MRKEQLLIELQMITGILSDDPTYLYNEMIKGASNSETQFNEEYESVSNKLEDRIIVDDLNEWFDKL